MTEQTQSIAGQASIDDDQVMLKVDNLKMYFPIMRGIFARAIGFTKAADDVSFFIRNGETLGLVGESGCGKTTVGRCIVRAFFTDRSAPTTGKMATPAEMKERVAYILQRVGLRPEYMQRYPHAFSGGERQRISIARALITNPRLVVCDEAVSALDVSIRAQILNLLEELQADFKLTYLFISHDLSVIRHICDDVVVMYVGQVVEIAKSMELFINPRHPYTEALMSAVPVTNPKARDAGVRIRLEGEIADPSNPPTGCYFHPRCRYAKERCKIEKPALRDLGDNHYVACHFSEELTLAHVRMVD